MPSANDPKCQPNAAANLSTPPKKGYQPPTVKVYGDVRDLTGSGPSAGVHDIALSSPHFS